jgi:hypothetical protein
VSTGKIGGRTVFICDEVKVVAKDEFFSHINGWEGTIQGLNNGLFEVLCQREDGEKTFFIPGDQLAFAD